MPSTQAKAAIGLLLQMSDSTGGNHATIAEVMDTDYDVKADTVDVTAHSNGTRYRQFITTLFTVGVTFQLNLTPNESSHKWTSPAGVGYVLNAGVERSFKIIDPDVGTLITFNAIVTSYKSTYAVAAQKKAAVTLQGTGAPTYAL